MLCPQSNLDPHGTKTRKSDLIDLELLAVVEHLVSSKSFAFELLDKGLEH